MIALALLASTSFSAPEPINQEQLFSGFWGQPRSALVQTLVATTTTVNPYGYVEACNARVLVGSRDWAVYTCQWIKKYGQFRPARINGQRAYGVYRQRVRWLTGRNSQSDPLPSWDVDVPVPDASAAMKLPAHERIQFVVDANGAITSCGAAGEWEHPQLAAEACTRLPQQVNVTAARTRSGKATLSVQNAAVRLSRSPL